MPQVDLETLLRQGRGGGGDDGRTSSLPDTPPNSFYLSKEEEIVWFNENIILQRKESSKKKKKKGNANLDSTSRYSYYNRLSSNAAAAAFIIGFRIRHDIRPTVKSSNTNFFPKRSTGLRLNEPSSPTISCTGRVQERKRHRSKKPNNSIWSRFKGALFGKWKKKGFQNSHAIDHDDEPMVARYGGIAAYHNHSNPPSLANLNRFVSGRKSDSWAGDLDSLEANE